MKKSITCLVARNKAGKFFGLNQGIATTSVFECDHPYDAKKVFLWEKEDYNKPFREAPYYFENSSRMRSWLEGFEMVKVHMTITAEIAS